MTAQPAQATQRRVIPGTIETRIRLEGISEPKELQEGNVLLNNDSLDRFGLIVGVSHASKSAVLVRLLERVRLDDGAYRGFSITEYHAESRKNKVVYLLNPRTIDADDLKSLRGQQYDAQLKEALI
jgi:hypothetical protein